MLKRSIALLLSLILIIGTLPMIAAASAEENGSESPVICIDKTYLRAGEDLSVTNPEG